MDQKYIKLVKKCMLNKYGRFTANKKVLCKNTVGKNGNFQALFANVHCESKKNRATFIFTGGVCLGGGVC